MSRDPVIIAGAGLAGVRTAVELRTQGWDGPLLLLGAEHHRPYDRPPLSKELLLDGALAEAPAPEGMHAPGNASEPEVTNLPGLSLETSLAADLEAFDVELRTGTPATALRPAERLLETGGGSFRYHHVVLATGAEARQLPGADGTADAQQPPGVHRLRTLDDARALRSALRPGAEVVVVGAGWIGAEVTTAARAVGCQVTVVEAAEQPLPGVLPDDAAAPMREWYTASGAELRTGTAVAAVRPGAVELTDGSLLAADAVLVGAGARPATDWLADSGVPLDRAGAVRADDRLRAEVAGVSAVGDCVSFPSARYGRRLLVQHWDHALQAPHTAATAVLHGSAAVPYDPVPYFWSEQFGRRVQFAGVPGAGDRLCWRGNPETDGWTVCWLRVGARYDDRGEVLGAVLTVDRPRDLSQARRLIERGAPLDPALVADPDTPLKAALR